MLSYETPLHNSYCFGGRCEYLQRPFLQNRLELRWGVFRASFADCVGGAARAKTTPGSDWSGPIHQSLLMRCSITHSGIPVLTRPPVEGSRTLAAALKQGPLPANQDTVAVRSAAETANSGGVTVYFAHGLDGRTLSVPAALADVMAPTTQLLIPALA
jgi:hypothetical protein